MGRTIVRYDRKPDPASQAQRQAASQASQQRQAQVSAYAAARFNEWQQNAAQREQSLQYRNQILQSQAEMAGLKDRESLYHQGEIDRQTKMFLSGLPVLREQLKNANIKPGSREYAAEISAFAQHIPDAFVHVPEIQKRLGELSQVDKTAAEIADKIKTVNEAFNLNNQQPSSYSSTARGDIDVKATRSMGGDPNQDLKALKLTPTEFLNHINAKQGKFDESGKFTQGLNPGEQANAIQFQAGTSKNKDTAGQIVTHNIPLAQFNQIRQAQGLDAIPVYSAPAKGTPQASPTPAEMVQLIAPDGTSRQVPKDQADHYIKLGATLNQ